MIIIITMIITLIIMTITIIFSSKTLFEGKK